jgi:hypothetical protein
MVIFSLRTDGSQSPTLQRPNAFLREPHRDWDAKHAREEPETGLRVFENELSSLELVKLLLRARAQMREHEPHCRWQGR